jgi:hypothetical protein
VADLAGAQRLVGNKVLAVDLEAEQLALHSCANSRTRGVKQENKGKRRQRERERERERERVCVCVCARLTFSRAWHGGKGVSGA